MTYRTLLALTACCLTGCKPDITGLLDKDLGPAPKMSVVSGAGQSVPLGAKAVASVRLVRNDGSPMAGELIAFLYLETIPNQIGGGSITHSTTNADGVAQWTATTTRVGPFTMTASFYECATVAFKECPNPLVRASASITGTITAP